MDIYSSNFVSNNECEVRGTPRATLHFDVLTYLIRITCKIDVDRN